MNFIYTCFILSLINTCTGCETEDPPHIIIGKDTYFVATNGNDKNPGTIERPWATWDKAFHTADAGDTVYFRGGTYPHTGNIYINPQLSNSGVSGNPICYFNYPGETPILDGARHYPSTKYNSGLVIQDLEYLHFKGLTIRNIFQYNESISAGGAGANGCSNFIIENITVYNIGGPGLVLIDCDTMYLTNCDVFNCADTFNTTTAGSGGTADGFQLLNYKNTESYYYIKGCRSWSNSDDGFDTNSEGFCGFEDCWSFRNGDLDGDGSGFKYGHIDIPSTGLHRSFIHCLAAFNAFSGFNENNNFYQCMNVNAFNNTSYANNTGFLNFSNYVGQIKDNIYRNNISYKNTDGVTFWGPVQHDNNSWDSDPSVQITDDDFLSVNPAELTGPRKADGSLPKINFLKPTKGSNLIDAGVDIGLPYFGNAPDLGYFEIE